MPTPTLSFLPYHARQRSSTPLTDPPHSLNLKYRDVNFPVQVTRTVIRSQKLALSTSSPFHVVETPVSGYHVPFITPLELTYLLAGLVAVVCVLTWLGIHGARRFYLVNGSSERMGRREWDREGRLECQRQSIQSAQGRAFSKGHEMFQENLGYRAVGKDISEKVQVKMLGRNPSAFENMAEMERGWVKDGEAIGGGDGTSTRSRSNSQLVSSGKRLY